MCDLHDDVVRLLPRQTVTVNAFQSGMQQLAAAVNIVTAHCNGNRHGMTATAVCSLSADPPSLILCVNRSSRSCRPILDSKRFCVNVLAEHQGDVAHRFANSSLSNEEKFDGGGSWAPAFADVPVLDGCVANFVCHVANVMEVKTHVVVVGHIEEVRVREDMRPLLYLERKYRTLAPHVETLFPRH